jgi:8-oxo-dGTP pyrophosphatase MutT (NUDIX family)
MPHIHTAPGQHDLTVSAWIVDTSQETPRLWLHMHKKFKALMQFGGHVELDENPWQSLCREIVEETGFDLDQLRVLQPPKPRPASRGMKVWPQSFAGNTHPVGSDHFHDDICFGFVTDQQPRGSVAATESQDLRLLTLEEIMSMPAEAFAPNVLELVQFLFDRILTEWQPVAMKVFD